MQQEIRQQWFFHRTPAEVWEYLTQPDLLELWLGKTDFKPIKGQQFRFYSPYGNDSICEVLEVSPFTRLSYSWQKNSSKDKTISLKPWAVFVEKRKSWIQQFKSAWQLVLRQERVL